MFNEWPPTPAGNPSALIRSSICPITSILPPRIMCESVTPPCEYSSVAPASTCRLTSSRICVLSSTSGMHTMLWIGVLRLALYFCTAGQHFGSNWIVLMPQPEQFERFEDFGLGVVGREQLRGVHQVPRMGPSAD